MIRFSICLLLILHLVLAIIRPMENCPKDETYKKCPKGWKLFDRQSGKWCIRAFSGVMDREEAVEKCKSKGGTLSGIENEKENEYIVESGKALVEDDGDFWIGLKRVPECVDKKSNQDGCTSANSFAWTDNSTTGSDGIIWNKNQPDNSYGASQECGVIVIAKGDAEKKLASRNFVVGKLDDIACTVDSAYKSHSVRKMAGYVCGMKPKKMRG